MAEANARVRTDALTDYGSGPAQWERNDLYELVEAGHSQVCVDQAKDALWIADAVMRPTVPVYVDEMPCECGAGGWTATFKGKVQQ